MALQQMIPLGWNKGSEAGWWGVWVRGRGRLSERNKDGAVEKNNSWKGRRGQAEP